MTIINQMLKTSLLILFLTCLTMQSRILNKIEHLPYYAVPSPLGILRNSAIGSFVPLSTDKNNLEFQYRGKISSKDFIINNTPMFAFYSIFLTRQYSWFNITCNNKSLQLNYHITQPAQPHWPQEAAMIGRDGSFVTTDAQLERWPSSVNTTLGYCWVELSDAFYMEWELKKDPELGIGYDCSLDPTTPYEIQFKSAPVHCIPTDSKNLPWNELKKNAF